MNWAVSVKGMPPPGGARKEEPSSAQEHLALPQNLDKPPKALETPDLKGLDALLAVADDDAASKLEGSSASDEDAARNGRAEKLEQAAPHPPSRYLAEPALTSEVLAHTPTPAENSFMDGVVSSKRPYVKSCRQAMEVAQRAVFVYHHCGTTTRCRRPCWTSGLAGHLQSEALPLSLLCRSKSVCPRFI